MGETLVFADELGAYTLSDRGTWLSMRAKLHNLRLLAGGRRLDENRDPRLRNAYGVMAVNPDTHPSSGCRPGMIAQRMRSDGTLAR
jgi:tungstate transport system substrate-binding protein